MIKITRTPPDGRSLRFCLIDTGDNTAAIFVPVSVAGAPKSAMGDTNARVIAEINPLAMQASMAAN